MFLPFTVRINFFRVLKNVANFEPSAFISFFSIPRAIFSHSPPINLHPWKWFEGYPVKSALFFSGWQEHLRFSRAWHQIFFKVIVIQKEKKQPGLFSFWTTMAHFFSQVATLENLSCFCHPEKNRADFTRYPSNHFQGCRLNGGVYHNNFWNKITFLIPSLYFACISPNMLSPLGIMMWYA